MMQLHYLVQVIYLMSYKTMSTKEGYPSLINACYPNSFFHMSASIIPGVEVCKLSMRTGPPVLEGRRAGCLQCFPASAHLIQMNGLLTPVQTWMTS